MKDAVCLTIDELALLARDLKRGSLDLALAMSGNRKVAFSPQKVSGHIFPTNCSKKPAAEQPHFFDDGKTNGYLTFGAYASGACRKPVNISLYAQTHFVTWYICGSIRCIRTTYDNFKFSYLLNNKLISVIKLSTVVGFWKIIYTSLWAL